MDSELSWKSKWNFILLITVGLIVLAAWAVVPVFSYNRWDNFEYLLPLLTQAHGLWLKGIFPYWNTHQHLGEPLLCFGQPGVFYFPYTLSLALTHLFAAGSDSLILIVVLLHLPWAAAGWFWLLREWRVRPVIAYAAGISICFGGFVTLISTVWGQFTPLFSWLPWTMLGAVKILDNKSFVRSALWFPAGLLAWALIGYPQILVYGWIWMGLFAILYAGFIKNSWSPPRRLVLPALGAALLSSPAILPLLQAYFYTIRTTSYGLSAFFEGSVTPGFLFGLLLPFYCVPKGFLGLRSSLPLYQGAWLVPIFLVSVPFALVRWKFFSDQPDALAKKLLISFGLGLIFLLLALGQYGGLYGLTHGIPIWSSLRWPFKFLLFSQAGLGIAAAVGLEWWARLSVERNILKDVYGGIFILVCFSALFMMRCPVIHLNAADVLAVIGGVGTLVTVPLVARKRWLTMFAFFVVLSSAALLGESHNAGLKTYPESYGSVNAEKLGINTEYRLLPMSESSSKRPIMQELGLFHSATMNGYRSATGCTMAMEPSWYLRFLPSNVTGVLLRPVYSYLLGSYLLKSWNVRYVAVEKKDTESIQLLEQRGYRRLKELAASFIYEDSGEVLPPAYFADHVYPYTPSTLEQGLVQNGATLRSAYVERSAEQRDLPPATVISSVWRDNKIKLRVSAPAGGFLVVSTTYFPDWSVKVDGKESPILRTNGTVQGVWIPPGGSNVLFYYHSLALDIGLCLAVLGCVVLWFWMKERKIS